MKPQVSFVVPVYNGAATVGSCLQSILNQTGSQAFEVIVVDNASTDATCAVVSGYPVKIVTEPRRGRSYARNRGLFQARGTWVAFVDCDVILATDWLSKMLAAIEGGGYDAGQGSIIPTPRDGSLFFDYRYKHSLRATQGSFNSLDNSFFIYPMINTAACVYRTDHLVAARGLDPELKTYEDADLSWRLWLAGAAFCAVKEARAEVQWPGTVLDYFLRSYTMGRGHRRLYALWSISLGVFSVATTFRKELLSWSSVIGLSQEFLRTLGVAIEESSLGRNPSRASEYQPQRRKTRTYLRKYFLSRDRALVLAPSVRLVQTRDSLILKDIQTMRKVAYPLRSEHTGNLMEVVASLKDQLVADGMGIIMERSAPDRSTPS